MANGVDPLEFFFNMLAAHRTEHGLVPAGAANDGSTIAVLVGDEHHFLSRNGWIAANDPPGERHQSLDWGNGLNAVTPSHAEAGAFNQFFFARDQGLLADVSRVVFVVDRAPCPHCRRSGGLPVLAARAGLTHMFLLWRSGQDEGMFSWEDGDHGMQEADARPAWVDEALHAAQAGIEEIDG